MHGGRHRRLSFENEQRGSVGDLAGFVNGLLTNGTLSDK